MSTISRIRRHVSKLAEGGIFTTRHLLGYGTRNAVDLATSKLAKKGRIARLARGVYFKPICGSDTRPSLPEVVKAKMDAWGKIFCAKAALPEPSKLPRQGRSVVDIELNYCVSGCTTSFICARQRVELKGTSPRKLDLGSTPMAKLARSIWQHGRANIDEDYMREIFRELFRPEKNEMASFFRQLPMWINDHLDWARNPRPSRHTVPKRAAGDLIF
jgi:hypothetical protein